MRCAPAVCLACLLWGVVPPAGAQDSPGTDVFEAHESPQQALQRIQKAKNRPVRRRSGETPVAVPYLPDDSLRSRSLTGSSGVLPAARDFPASDPGVPGNGPGKEVEPEEDKGERAEDKGEEDKEEKDHDKDRDDDRDDDDDDDGKKKGKG